MTVLTHVLRVLFQFSSVNNDNSMTMLRNGDTVKLKECFQYFSEW